MTKKQLIANKPEISPKSESGDLPQRRKTENLPEGLYYFEDELETDGVLKANVITSAGWLLELLKLDAGEISFFSGAEEIRPSFTQLAIFYPPFTITRPCFKNVRASLKGIAGIAELPAEFSKKPVVFEEDFTNPPKSAAEVVEILQSSRGGRFVDANPKASLLSLKAKRLIDENYRIFPSIARIAARLKGFARTSDAAVQTRLRHQPERLPASNPHRRRLVSPDAGERDHRGFGRCRLQRFEPFLQTVPQKHNQITGLLPG